MVLGTAIKISAVSNLALTSSLITINDPSGTAIITDASMTDMGGGVNWQYIWQSDDLTNVVGVYTVYIKGYDGTYYTKIKSTFALDL